jgi:hypothetical protein
MTDHELVNMAAKAAGYTLESDFDMHDRYWPWCVELEDHWCPLSDNGDALNLAVKVGLNNYFGIEIHKKCTQSTCFDPWEHCEYEEHNDDPYAATRRSITRAAAIIGREMK